MLPIATFSIVACDLQEQALGIAVASKFLAVGAVVPWGRAGAGGVATQSYANTSFGPIGLQMMESGVSAGETLQRLIADDDQREQRQVGMVDHRGQAASFTGNSCYPWAGGFAGEGYAVQGNLLTDEEVVQSMADAFLSSAGSLPGRLFRALQAGDRAGGDRRGRQSAAILVVKPGGGYAGFNDRWVDYRVDDHPDPVSRLGELLALHELYFDESPPEEKVRLEGENLRLLQAMMTRLGYYQGTSHGEYDPQTRQALRAFIGNENFEDRTDFESGWIDKPVLEYLSRRFGSQS